MKWKNAKKSLLALDKLFRNKLKLAGFSMSNAIWITFCWNVNIYDVNSK